MVFIEKNRGVTRLTEKIERYGTETFDFQQQESSGCKKALMTSLADTAQDVQNLPQSVPQDSRECRESHFAVAKRLDRPRTPPRFHWKLTRRKS